jgi:FkbM family methyltransferase
MSSPMETSAHLLRLMSVAPFYAPLSEVERRRSNKNIVDLFFGILRTYQPALFVEAGAKDAATSVKASNFLPDARIVAFEASPHNYAHFSNAPALEESRVEYRHNALTDRNGPVTFNIQTRVGDAEVDKVRGNNSILKRARKDTEYEEVTVEGITLDSLFQDNAVESCAMWVDVEGAAEMVLKGAEWLLARTGLMLIEVEDHSYWDGQWTTRQVVEHLCDKGLVPVARDFEYRRQHNILFVSDEVIRSGEFWRNMDYFLTKLVPKPILAFGG